MSTITTEEPRWPELHKARRAIVVVDVVESVRLMQQHEDDVIDRWRRFVHEVRTEVLPPHGGRLVKSLGDGMLLEFGGAPAAVAAALEIQRLVASPRMEYGSAAPITLRVGVNLANVVVDEFDVYGMGVNVAARLASLAKPGEVIVSAEVHDQLLPGIDSVGSDMGECHLKHMESPVHAFRLACGPSHHAPPVPWPAPQIPSAASIVVLPLEGTTGDSLSDVLGEATSERLIESLSRHHGLRVISRLTSRRFKGRAVSGSDLGRLLGVQFVLSGSCRCTDDAMAIHAELSSTVTNAVVWAGSCRLAQRELFTTESGTLAQIAQTVGSAMASFQVRWAMESPLPNVDSYSLQLAAVVAMHRSSSENLARVREMLEQLIERHGRCASPRAWLAKWYVLRATRGLLANPRAEAAEALDQTKRALDLEPHCSLALAMQGFVHCHLLHDVDTAAARLDTAVVSNPGEALAWLLKGAVHAFRDEGSVAVRCTERALELSPLDPMRYYFESLAATAALAAGRYEAAEALARASLNSNAAHTSTYRSLAIALVMQGREAEAAQTVQALLLREPAFTVSRFLQRVPGGETAISKRFAQALAAAGVPD